MAKRKIVGIDLGGTRFRIGVVTVDSSGNLDLPADVKEFSSPRNWEEFVQVLRDHQEQAKITPEGYAIAIAGSIDKHIEVTKAPSLPWLDGINVPKKLAPCLGLNPEQIVILNDMEAAAYGERAKGILKGYEWAIFDTISTGWGGALILNGEVVVGEPGHVNLGFSLPYVCGCGNVGCVEALYSGSAMGRRILHHLHTQDILFPSDLGDKVWDYFYKELETGAAWAVALMEEWAEAVGRAWANVLNRISPIEAIVYMGSTAENLIPRGMPHIRATMQRICMFPKHTDPKQPLPIEQASELNRSIYGSVIVYLKYRRYLRMNLPDGVQYNPGQRKSLISIGTDPTNGLITIHPSLGYTVNERSFRESFQALFSKDYNSFAQQYHLMKQSPIYSGAEHNRDPKLPNITVVPNTSTSQGATLFGCTMGHWHGQTDCRDGIQEIYEFQSYGALLIDRPESDEVELWIARDGDKVIVPQQCHMTLYNMDDLWHPLITLDFANPKGNYANKELVKKIGPILLAYYTAHEVIFLLNDDYINRDRIIYEDTSSSNVDNERCLNGGVHLAGQVASREVRIPLGTRASLGEQIYEALTEDPAIVNQFNKLGIQVHKASPEGNINGVWYKRPLVECVKLGNDSPLYKVFFPSTTTNAVDAASLSSEDIPVPKKKMHTEESIWCELGPRFLEPGRTSGQPSQRDIQVLIEGAGTWVEKAFIPSIAAAREELAKRRQQGQSLCDLKVIIADDSRWHTPGGKTPVMPSPQDYPQLAASIKAGEVVFLDKADPQDLEFYRGLTPGVVFVVTPDYTHSQLCQSHLDHASTIFVEKPFDANWKNVRNLLEARGRAKLDTQVYALDHYRFYAWRIKEQNASGKTLLEEATEWLGGALRAVKFFMTEEKPIDPHRAHSLQYGLLLDLLPHCFGMLAFFGQLGSLDEFEVVDVGQYHGAPIQNETFAHVRFTFEDYSNNGWRVPCEACVGKGLGKGRKYFEVIGRNGNSVLITFGDTNWRGPAQRDQKIEGGVYFVSNGQMTRKADLAPSNSRYAQLFVDMVTGERKAIISAMPLIAGEQIVHGLDRFWRAIQMESTWSSYRIGKLDCFKKTTKNGGVLHD